MIVNEIPVMGKFIVRTTGGEILHRFDPAENDSGDIAPEVCMRNVLAVYVEKGFCVLEVAK